MTPYAPPHFPMNRAALCLDCFELTEVGEQCCPACSGGALWTLSVWLDREREMVGAPAGHERREA